MDGTTIKMPTLREVKPTARGRFHNGDVAACTENIRQKRIMKASLASMPKSFYKMPGGN